MNLSLSFAPLPLLLAAALTGAGCTCSAEELAPGASAPPFHVGKWIQGGPVQELDPLQPYILQFWSPDSEPAHPAMAHLSELAEEFKGRGLIVIGIQVWSGEDKAAGFAHKLGDKMAYPVALDDHSSEPEGFMAAHWWKKGVSPHVLPVAFLIGTNRQIAWIGNPAKLKQKLVADMLEGKLDLEKTAARFKTEQREKKHWLELNEALPAALQAGRWDDASALLDDMVEHMPASQREQCGVTMRFQILLGQRKYEEAYNLAQSYSRSHPQDSYRLNELARIILTQGGVEQRNLPLALQYARQANQHTEGTRMAILETLARAQFMNGLTNQAVGTQQQALALAQGREKTALNKTLLCYQQGQLPPPKN